MVLEGFSKNEGSPIEYESERSFHTQELFALHLTFTSMFVSGGDHALHGAGSVGGRSEPKRLRGVPQADRRLRPRTRHLGGWHPLPRPLPRSAFTSPGHVRIVR